ncbi:hypothetical protein IL306_007356 [Fusarium sp. DS 682]|nr:hypothetical protein IL306_007356 [Fusarium sp. DS 682]
MVWTTRRERGSVNDGYFDRDLLRVLRRPLEMAVHRLGDGLGIYGIYPGLNVPPLDYASDPEFSSTHFTQVRPYGGALEESFRSAKLLAEPKSGIKSTLENADVKSNFPPGKISWENLRDQAESRLESGDNKHALEMFQECLRMEIPFSTAIWGIKSDMAFARMMLGQYVQAEYDFRQLRDEVGQDPYQTLKPTITNIHGRILVNHALALFRLGKYHEMKLCLNEIILPSEYELLASKQPKEQLTNCKLSISVCRLRALAIPNLGFLYSSSIREELNAADKWCQELDKLNAAQSSEKPDKDKTEDEWCEELINIQSSEPLRISNALNKSRINVLRGHYRQALSILEPALSDAILEMGETNLLTIEIALLTSFLQVEMGQVHEGRISCERCAEVIEEAFGNEHPLALEAEYILISASQHEGIFTLALDDAASLCRRAESNVDLGHNHPSTLKYKSQLGGLQIECGNYSTAEAILMEVQKDAVGLWSREHLEVLRIRSQLALAQYHLGKLEIAEETIFSVLHCQLRKYLRYQEDKLWRDRESNEDIRTFLKDRPLLHGIGEAFAASSSETATHPDILYTLLTCGKILMRKPSADLDLALKILGLIRDAGKRKLGHFHPLPLMACLTIGEIHSTTGMMKSDYTERRDLYRKAISCFTSLTKPETESSNSTKTAGKEIADLPDLSVPLDSDHPIILHAMQECIMVRLLKSEFEDEIPHTLDYRNELQVILAAQGSRPGRNHRQTIKTLVTILTLELCLEEPSTDLVKKVSDELRWIIERADAEHERFLECLLLRERIARILRSHPELFRDEFFRVWKSMKQQIEEGQTMEDTSVREAVKRVEGRMQTMLPLL